MWIYTTIYPSFTALKLPIKVIFFFCDFSRPLFVIYFHFDQTFESLEKWTVFHMRFIYLLRKIHKHGDCVRNFNYENYHVHLEYTMKTAKEQKKKRKKNANIFISEVNLHIFNFIFHNFNNFSFHCRCCCRYWGPVLLLAQSCCCCIWFTVRVICVLCIP